MADAQRKQLIFTGIRGRDGSNVSDLEIPPWRARDVVNCDFYRTPFARKRNGAADVLASTTGEAFTAAIASLLRFVPGADETAMELFGVDSAATPNVQRLAGGTVWATVTVGDAIATRPQDVVYAVLNGKLFVAYDSTVNRLHVWDTTSWRRVGLVTPAAPTVANTGSGSYAATARNYKTAWTTQSAGSTVRRSELSAAVAFTPSGSGTAARVTRPALPSPDESETHWELYGAATTGDTGDKLLATTAVATTTYDDSTAPGSYSGAAPPTVGTNTVPTSVRYLLSDGNRLLMAGGWESGAFNNRVWFTPVLGSSDIGDDERIPDTTTLENWVTLDENDGGFITGLGGPLEGYPFAFKYAQIWRLIPTGDVNAPYIPRAIHKGSGIGCVAHKAIVMAEDEAGRPALYFWSPIGGCFRIGANGLQYCGRDNEDITVNLGASNVVACGVYFRARRQVWFAVATGTSNDPDRILVFDVRKGRVDENGEVRGGWSIYTGDLAALRCLEMFTTSLGASMGRTLAPYLGQTGGTRLWRADSGTDDVGTAFQAYVDLPTRHPAGLERRCTVANPYVLASADSQTLRVTVTADYDAVADRTDDEDFTAAGSETRVVRRFEGVEAADVGAVQIRVGDGSAVSNGWNIDAVLLPYEPRELI